MTTYTVSNLHDSVIPPANPMEKLDWLLEHIARKTGNAPGAVATLDLETDYPVIFAESAKELHYHIRNAKMRGLIEGDPPLVAGTKVRDYTQHEAILTLKGWSRIEELKKTRRDSRQAFVAMWFHKSMADVWENGFKLALRQTGFSPLRIDLKEHSNKICDEVIAEIRKSGILVADFTGHRAGVYFEAGFAMGLGIPVIWTCRESDIEKAHFDTRQYNHIVWTNSNDLLGKLVKRIEATILV